MKLPLSAPRLGLAVAVLAGASALVASATASSSDAPSPVSQTSSSDDDPGDISGPCDEAEHANDPRCTGADGTARPDAPDTTASTATTMPTAPAPAGGDTRTVNAGAGTVTYRVDNGSLTLVSATPNAGWVVEVEQSAGREVELDFRSGTRRVQVNLEFEDGQVRERVRARDDADDSDIRIENGVVVRHETGDDHGGDDRHGDDGHGDDNSGPGSSGGDDNSGSGSSGSGSSGSHG